MEAVTVDGWQGGRGQAAYALSRAAEQDKWAVYATLLAKAGATLSTYAGRFTAAQSKAADAIARWTEGEEATEAALTQYNTSVAPTTPTSTARSRCRRTAAARRRRAWDQAGPDRSWTRARRCATRLRRSSTRPALNTAGDAAVKDLGGLEGAKTEGSSGPSAGGSAEGPSFSWDGFEETFGKNPAEGSDGKYDGDPDAEDSPFKISLGKVEGQAAVWGAEGSVEGLRRR